MVPTLEYLNRRFDYYNNLCFEGKLPKIPVELTTSKRFLGNFSYRKNRLTRKCTDVKIKSNRLMDCDEAMLDDTLIHEMIHYYIFVNKIKDTSAHGRVFVEVMKAINEQFGRHLEVSHKTLEGEESVIKHEPTKRIRLVAVVAFRDGRFGIKVVPASQERLNLFNSRIKRISDILTVDYYLTEDPFFGQYPCSVALRFCIVAQSDYLPHLANARKI